MPLAFHREGQRPGLVAVVPGAVAARVAAACVTAREGAGQKIGRYGKAAEELELSLTQARGLGSARLAIHIVATMLLRKARIGSWPPGALKARVPALPATEASYSAPNFRNG